MRHDDQSRGFSVHRWQVGGCPWLSMAAVSTVATLTVITASAQWLLQVLVSCATATCLLLYANQPVEESVEVVEGVGVVLRTRRRHGGWRSELIDIERVRAVIINEAVTTTDVQFYLAFVLHDAAEMAVAFPNLLPRLEALQPIYQAVHGLLAGHITASADDALDGSASRREAHL